MRFKINGQRADGTLTHWIFDNQTLEIINENGVPAFLESDPRFDDFRPSAKKPNWDYFDETHPIIGKENIKTVKLSLGFKCNYKCDYCWQRQFEQYAYDATPAQVEHFLLQLEQVDLSKATRFEIWGGEPLVYWKTLKLLIPALTRRYPHMKIFGLTNGSLLTKEIAQFMIDHDVYLGISHDAQGFTSHRNKEDPLDNEKTLSAIRFYCQERYKKSQRAVWFSVVVTRDNRNLDEMYPYFEARLGKDVPFYAHVDNAIETATKEDYERYAFNQEERQELHRNILKICFDSNHPLHEDLSKQVKQALYQIVNKVTPDQNPVGCDMANKSVLALNFLGDVLPCHSFPAEKIGHVSSLAEVKQTKLHHWRSREICYQCPILPVCHGGKPCVTNEEQQWLCEQLIIWKYPIFCAAWQLIFDAAITSIEGAN